MNNTPDPPVAGGQVRRRLREYALPSGIAELQCLVLREAEFPAYHIQSDAPEALHSAFLTLIASKAFSWDQESLWVLLLTKRFRPIGFQMVSLGTVDTIVATPLEIFRPAIIAGAPNLALVHNHPSGDVTPSEADVRFTRDILRAGQLLKINVVDHIIEGNPNVPSSYTKRWLSLREAGYLFI